jgi:EamA domain-containing membrane protein RarD
MPTGHLVMGTITSHLPIGVVPMRERQLSIADIFLIGGTRVALGIGIGLLISERFNQDQRKAAGWSLLAMGAVTTIPLAINVVGSKTSLASIDKKVAA